MQPTQYQKCQEHEMLATSMMDMIGKRMMVIDQYFTIMLWNRASETATGKPAKLVIGKNLFDQFPWLLNDDEMLAGFTEAFNGHSVHLPAVPNLLNRHHYDHDLVPLRNNDGKVKALMIVMEDVSIVLELRKQLEKIEGNLKKKEAEIQKAAQELKILADITAKEIGSPLKNVYTSLEILAKKEGSQLSNMGKGNLRRMQSSINRMNLLLEDLIRISQAGTESTEMETVWLKDIVDEAVNRLNHKIEERAAMIRTGRLPHLRCYPALMADLLTALLDNALKFQEEGNIPAVSIIAETEVSYVFEKYRERELQEYVRISVVDNGIGFREEDEKMMFEMFGKLHGRRFPGSGIGLKICSKIVEKHGGFMKAESRYGKGSDFSCYIPSSVT